MGVFTGVRTKPAYASGFISSLQIAPRGYPYTVCSNCNQKLFFTYVGEDCPHCGAVVTVFVEGCVPPLHRMAEACIAASRGVPVDGSYPSPDKPALGNPSSRVRFHSGRSMRHRRAPRH